MRKEHNPSTEKRSLKDKLMAVILLESSKDYKDIDDAFTIECVDFLMELEKEKRINKSEIDQSVDKISYIEKISTGKPGHNKKRRLKTLGIIAAVLAVIFSIFIVSAVARGDDFDTLVNNWIRVIHELKEGEIIRLGDNITFTKAKEQRTYGSIEELLREEKIDILYPSWLPEDKKVNIIDYSVDGYSGERTYTFITDTVVYNIGVHLDSKFLYEPITDFTVKEINGMTVYYKYYDNEIFWQANFDYKGMMYSVHAYTEEDLLKIIENLKEIE